MATSGSRRTSIGCVLMFCRNSEQESAACASLHALCACVPVWVFSVGNFQTATGTEAKACECLREVSGSSDSPCWALSSCSRDLLPCRETQLPFAGVVRWQRSSCWLPNGDKSGTAWHTAPERLLIPAPLTHLIFSYCVSDLSDVWHGNLLRLYVKGCFLGQEILQLCDLPQGKQCLLCLRMFPNNCLLPGFIRDLCWISNELGEEGEGNQGAVVWPMKSWLLGHERGWKSKMIFWFLMESDL